MNNESPTFLEIPFAKELIYQQLQRIFSDPLFENSEILKKFLSFIVEETLIGHAHMLKEYTIAVKVLNKPINFKPQENGIVRIHAGRLRRALNHYYSGKGTADPIHISMPRGSYVPVFDESNDNTKNQLLEGNENISIHKNDKTTTNNSVVVAVIPFWHLPNDKLQNSLADGLGMQLSTALMQFENFSVVAYYTIRNLHEKITDIATIASTVAAQYIVTGNIQIQEDCFRIHIQMIDTRTSQLIFSRMYVGKLTSQNIFTLQDKIEKCFIADLSDSRKLTEKEQINKKIHKTSVMAVA